MIEGSGNQLTPSICEHTHIRDYHTLGITGMDVLMLPNVDTYNIDERGMKSKM